MPDSRQHQFFKDLGRDDIDEENKETLLYLYLVAFLFIINCISLNNTNDHVIPVN